MLLATMSRVRPLSTRRVCPRWNAGHSIFRSVFAGHGGIFFPDIEASLNKLAPPGHSEVCEPAPLKGARESDVTNAKNDALKLHLNWGHASAHQLKRFLVESGRPT